MRKIWLSLCLVCLVSFSAFAADGNGVQVKTLAKSTLSWDSTPLPGYPQGQPEVTILDITIPPGVSLPLHTHPVINAGILLEGRLTVITDTGSTLHLNAGEGIVEVVNTWHYGRNEGTVPARIVVFYAGIADAPVTVSE
jgi:quercetin dioxygenase-like cupin family protein